MSNHEFNKVQHYTAAGGGGTLVESAPVFGALAD